MEKGLEDVVRAGREENVDYPFEEGNLLGGEGTWAAAREGQDPRHS